MSENNTAGLDVSPSQMTPNECDTLTKEQVELYSIVSWWFEFLLQALVGSIGFVANTLAIPILCSREMSTIFNLLLVFLAVFDNFYIICSVLEGIRKHNDYNQIHEYAFGYILYQFHNFVLCCSIYITLALTLERYRAVWRPVEYHNRCKGASPWRRIATYIIPVFVFSIIFNIPKFFEVELVIKPSEVVRKVVYSNGSLANVTEVVNQTLASPTSLRLDDNYVILYVNLARLLVQGVLPFLLLSILNYRIYWVIKRRRGMVNRPAANQNQKKANETQQAIVLFIIVLLFFICHTPRFVLNIHEFLTLDSLRMSIKHDCDNVSLWALIIASISHFLMTLNSSVNFFIYCFMCATFRRILFRLARKMTARLVNCVSCGFLNVPPEGSDGAPSDVLEEAKEGVEEQAIEFASRSRRESMDRSSPKNNNLLVTETTLANAHRPNSEKPQQHQQQADETGTLSTCDLKQISSPSSSGP